MLKYSEINQNGGLMKVHNKNLILLMIISIFVLITTSLVNINLSVNKIKEKEIKQLNSEILIYKKEAQDFYNLFNRYSRFLSKSYNKDYFEMYLKNLQSLILSDEYIKSGELYIISSKKLSYIGKASEYMETNWVDMMKKDKKEKLSFVEGKLYYFNTLTSSNKDFAYIALEIDKNKFFQDFFSKDNYFIYDRKESFVKSSDFDEELIFKFNTMSKTSKNIFEYNQKNSYVYYSYIEGFDWIIGLKGKYESSDEKFLLIRNFSISSILMIIIFGMLGIKSNRENISKPLGDIIDFLKNREDKNLIKSIEVKEKSELNEFVSAFDNFIEDQDKTMEEIKNSYKEVFRKNILIIRDFEEFLKKSKVEEENYSINYFGDLKKLKEDIYKFFAKVSRAFKHINTDYSNVLEKIKFFEKKLGSLATYFMNSIAIVNDDLRLIEDFENGKIGQKEFLNKLRQKNKKIKSNYDNFVNEFSKFQKNFEAIKVILIKDKDYQEKNELAIRASIEMIVREIKEIDFDKLADYEKRVEEIYKIREKEYIEFRKKANNLRYIKYSLNNFMEKINKL